jgi:hypothetical protein
MADLRIGMIARLKFLQQVPIVVEEYVVPALHQMAQRRDSEVRLANSARTHK